MQEMSGIWAESKMQDMSGIWAESKMQEMIGIWAEKKCKKWSERRFDRTFVWSEDVSRAEIG